MTQSRNRTRAQLQLYARLILLQWVLIAGLVCTIILMAIFVPKAKAADEVPHAPVPSVEQTPDTEPTAAVDPRPAETTALDFELPQETAEVTEPTPILVELGEFKLTAYCACKQCCGKDPGDPYYGITATGTTVTAGRTIAVDPSVIPYGTEVVINGHTYIAEDCGGAIRENRIDIYFETHEEALNFGVQYATVFIINNTI